MSIETAFLAALAAHAPLTALVDNGIAQDAAPSVETLPLVVFSVLVDRLLGLNGALHAERAGIDVQCWADTAAGARAVADAVVGAVATVPDKAVVTSDRGTYDPDLKLYGQILTVVWME